MKKTLASLLAIMLCWSVYAIDYGVYTVTNMMDDEVLVCEVFENEMTYESYRADYSIDGDRMFLGGQDWILVPTETGFELFLPYERMVEEMSEKEIEMNQWLIEMMTTTPAITFVKAE